MQLHANAELSLKRRARMVSEVVEQDRSISEAAMSAGVSARTCRKWVRRFRCDGELGLLDRSSAPRHVANRTAERRIAVIAALRRLRMTGPEISEVLDMPRLDGVGDPDADRAVACGGPRPIPIALRAGPGEARHRAAGPPRGSGSRGPRARSTRQRPGREFAAALRAARRARARDPLAASSLRSSGHGASHGRPWPRPRLAETAASLAVLAVAGQSRASPTRLPSQLLGRPSVAAPPDVSATPQSLPGDLPGSRCSPSVGGHPARSRQPDLLGQLPRVRAWRRWSEPARRPSSES